ncbi:hypothetical protein E2C01_098631 [Portunus trituberculatus]|uniref:FLYWCH-type domain-containing protein n=1 Tax=Portunus trituberculatus TaxID=210409 RepID=A0A5B7K861_PORTR|nr:hypothetical protein [Portunus trituberculatus]
MEVRVTKEHTHASRCEEAAVHRLKINLKQKAVEQPATHPATLIREELVGLSDSAVAALPERQSLRRLVNKSKASVRPSNPKNIDLQIAPSYVSTISGRPFLLHDNEGDTRSRIIIFATEDNVLYLFSSNMWYIDGTLQVVPGMFLPALNSAWKSGRDDISSCICPHAK